MKRAFTLIELIVVISIITVLSGVLLASFGGGTESARAAKCLSNLRNLAVSWSGGRAGSQEHLRMEVSRNNVETRYYEEKGWISSATDRLYPSDEHQTFEPIGLYETNRDLVDYAISNGWVRTAIGRDKSLLVCPTHVKKSRGKSPNWSYFMNAAFGWDACQGGYTYNRKVNSGYLEKSALVNAERLLIFAEIPFQGPGDWFPDAEGGSTDTDAILQFDGCDKCSTAAGSSRFNGSENIGGNHKDRRAWYAHVAFADGHVEKLRVDGLTGENLKELTSWLCQGKAVGRNGNRYEELK